MELTLLLLLIVLVAWFAKRHNDLLENNTNEVESLRHEVNLLRKDLEKRAVPAAPGPQAAKATTEEVRQTIKPSPVTPPPVEPKPVTPLPPQEPKREPIPVAAAYQAPIPAAKPTPAPEPSFFERHPDWEKFIGENLINKLGIAILVLGIGFFVKYAIDKDWINEVGRVAIGILAGGLLLGIAHRMRQDYKAFSSVLIGGGMAVLYFTIAIAFHEYGLFSQTVAFILMVGITGFTIFLSLAYDRIELAVLALVGGFGSPFMVSTGEGNYIVLFTFILILNLGILVLAYFKKWNLLNSIAYVFTIILYGSWLGTRVVNVPAPPFTGALVFASLFYLVFFLMNIINNVKERRQFTAIEIMMLLSNTFFYYGAGMYILQNVDGGAYKGIFTIVLAVFNLAFAYLLFRNQKADRNLVYLLIGLVLTFLSLTAPVQLQGNYITLFWALEAVLLLWLAQKSGINLIRIASVVVLGLMFLSLVIDWQVYATTDVSAEGSLSVILNKIFITGIVAVVALAATSLLLRKELENILITMLPASNYRAIIKVMLFALLYLVLLLELNYQLTHSSLNYSTRGIILGSYNYLYLLGLLLWAARQTEPTIRHGAVIVAALSTIAYLFLLHPLAIESRNLYLQDITSIAGFLWHYLPLLLLVMIQLLFLQLVRQIFGFKNRLGKASLWYFSFILVFLASAEMEHFSLLGFYQPDISISTQLSQIRKIGYPILWGIASFILMMVGMQRKLKTLRIISLTLFFLTLLKLFLVDIRGISEGGKIAAFICLGILLLVVSFMYQKLKNLILEDDILTEKPTTDAS